jgi:hypothetical protein
MFICHESKGHLNRTREFIKNTAIFPDTTAITLDGIVLAKLHCDPS